MLFGFCFVFIVLLLAQATSADKNSTRTSEHLVLPPPPPLDHTAQQMNEELGHIIEILDEEGIAE